MRILALAGVLAAGFVALMHASGRPLWCACGDLNPVSTDIWSAHNSQHLIDPYSATHVLHGVLFYLLLWALVGRDGAPLGSWSVTRRFWVAVLVEVGWELLENSPFVIDRYRTATIAIGYAGDSALNSLADVLCCATGFALAARLPVRASTALFVAVEIVMLGLYRDNLTLNMLMLLWPIPAIRQWQAP